MMRKKKPIKAHQGTIVYNEEAQNKQPLVSQFGVPQKTFDAVDGGDFNQPKGIMPIAPTTPSTTYGSTNPNNLPIYDPKHPNYNPAMEYITPDSPMYKYMQGGTKAEIKQPKIVDMGDLPYVSQPISMGYMNKGGMAMEQQMSLFDEGGMKDDGLKRDPISGNEIPPGSTAKEVRDDIPAQLSEGEYVVPADVVQYYGVKFFEDLRMEAKQGLAEMDRTGRIGGEPMSATIIAIGDAQKKKAQGGVIKANEGVLAEVDQVEQARSYNPSDDAVLGMGRSSAIGQISTNQPQATGKNNIQKIMYYDNDPNSPTYGQAKEVTFIDNIVTPAEDVKFTQPPWSINKPTPSQQQPENDRDRTSNQEPPKLDSWGMNADVYNFGSWDADRFVAEAEEQLKVSMGERLISTMATIANPIAGLAVTGMATADGFAKTKVMIDILNKAGDEETADTLTEMYDTALDNLPALQGWIMSTSIAKKGIDASATLIANQISKANSSFANFANNNSLNQKSSFKEVKYDQPIGPNLPPMQGPVQPSSNTQNFGEATGSNTVLPTSDSENIQNFGGRDVDVDATLANFNMGNNATNTTDDVSETDSTPTRDPVSADEEKLSEAYGGGEASKKFAMKKGGLATRTKRRKKK